MSNKTNQQLSPLKRGLLLVGCLLIGLVAIWGTRTVLSAMLGQSNSQQNQAGQSTQTDQTTNIQEQNAADSADTTSTNSKTDNTSETNNTTTTTDGSATNNAALVNNGVIIGVAADDPYATGKHHARLTIENYGTIELELNADAAPITVSRVCQLIQQGFYNGLTFHRIIDGFMMQGGDPKGDGTGGSDLNIKGEFSENGINNPLTHVRGAISMARSSLPDSASSQFFIVQTTTSSLDGSYAAFGQVTSGMDIVDQICKDAKVQDNNGTVAAADQPKITEFVLVD